MKMSIISKIRIHLTLLTLIFGLCGQSGSAQEVASIQPFIRLDSTYTFDWDPGNEAWLLNYGSYYLYGSNGNIDSVISENLTTGLLTSKSAYSYDDSGQLSMLMSYTWTGTWTPVTRNIHTYNELQQLEGILLQKLISGNWINNRWQNDYRYNEFGNLLQYSSCFWRDGEWSLPTVSFNTFDSLGRLEMRISYYPNGNTDSRVTYEYDQYGLRTKMYAQYPGVSGWNNLWLIEYEYNKCGVSIAQVRYDGAGTDWVPKSRTELFKSFNIDQYPERKVEVCFNGNTISIPLKVLDSFLNRGACLGSCLDENNNPKSQTNKGSEVGKSFSLLVYPNPTDDRLTISMTSENCQASRIELLDYNGRVIRTFDCDNELQSTIYLTDVQKGNYILRVIADKVYSTIITKN